MGRYLRREITDLSELPVQPPVCDFCSSAIPTWIYAATKMSTGENHICWRWCACDACANHVETHTTVVIADNLTRLLTERFPGISESVARIAAEMALHEFHTYSIWTPRR